MSPRSAKHFGTKTGNRSVSPVQNRIDPMSNSIQTYKFCKPENSCPNSPKTPQRFRKPERDGLDLSKDKGNSPRCYSCQDPQHYSNDSICYYYKFNDNPGKEKCLICGWIHKSSNCKRKNGGNSTPNSAKN